VQSVHSDGVLGDLFCTGAKAAILDLRQFPRSRIVAFFILKKSPCFCRDSKPHFKMQDLEQQIGEATAWSSQGASFPKTLVSYVFSDTDPEYR
jgi:hypothetical protein